MEPVRRVAAIDNGAAHEHDDSLVPCPGDHAPPVPIINRFEVIDSFLALHVEFGDIG